MTATDWRPTLGGGGAPIYARIADGLAADIGAGRLAAGARLPTQRALAERLGVGLGAVTRAYAEAESRGLIDAVVGRGSFVAAQPAAAPSAGPIDLSRNLAPFGPAREALRQAFAALGRRADLGQRLDYAPTAGFEADRQAGALWLRREANFATADASRLICCAGAQQAIAVALGALCRPGEALIVEEATFHGVKLAAAHAGLTLVAAPMDGEGLTPEGLDRATAQSSARAAYVLPFQNPTARVMGLARRREIIETARRRGVTLIEDDLYGPHVADLGLPPLAELAPDQVAYVTGLSKSLAPGLRAGYLAVPDHAWSAALEALRAVAFGPPTFGALLATQWIETGEAFEIVQAVREELARRTDLARRVLGDLVEPIARRESPHLWAPLSELEAERVAGQALRDGVELTRPQAPFVTGAPVSGLRICLGGPADLATLERGLTVVRQALTPGPIIGEAVV